MTAEGKDVNDDNIFVDAIDEPVFFVQPSRPVFRQLSFELFRFPGSCRWMFPKFVENFFDLALNGLVTALTPVFKIVVGPSGYDYGIFSHKSLASLTSRMRPLAMSSSDSFSTLRSS